MKKKPTLLLYSCAILTITIIVYLVLYLGIFGPYVKRGILFSQNAFGSFKNISLDELILTRSSNTLLYIIKREKKWPLQYGFMPVPSETDSERNENILAESEGYVHFKVLNNGNLLDVSFHILRGKLKNRFNLMVQKYNLTPSTVKKECLGNIEVIKPHELFKNWKGHLTGAKVYYAPSFSLLIISHNNALCSISVK